MAQAQVRGSFTPRRLLLALGPLLVMPLATSRRLKGGCPPPDQLRRLNCSGARGVARIALKPAVKLVLPQKSVVWQDGCPSGGGEHVRHEPQTL